MVQVETGILVPDSTTPIGREAYPFSTMAVNESFLVLSTSVPGGSLSVIVNKQNKDLTPKHFVYADELTGVRVWRDA